MAIVKVNRELLSDVVEDLQERHRMGPACICLLPNDRVCPTQQRINRLKAAQLRTPADLR